ncbi:hypothetical protein R1flu_015645 [Riccia fluitans]|uniref:Uncharacterized protein n=1 Tax=Riccia fluitans TaxID=41844 RepID=A0ABD1YKK8_9MARC
MSFFHIHGVLLEIQGETSFSPKEPEEGELQPEEGELLHLLPVQTQQTKKKKTGSKVSFFEVEERLQENEIARHAWFQWFLDQVNLNDMRKQYWTSGIDEGRKQFENKLVELGTIAFTQASIAPDTREFEHYTFQVELRLRKFITQASTQWVKEFETWIRNLTNGLPRGRTISSRRSYKLYKDCEPISDNKIRWINFMSWVTPMLKRCHLGVGMYGTVFKVGVLEPTLASDLGR